MKRFPDDFMFQLNDQEVDSMVSCPGTKHTVVVPEYNEIDMEIIKSNMRTVKMSREEYFELLNRI